ncbi:MAG: lamin tail domain-containing protein, partial [Oscillospiraceae bacterium]|nr:lamin tail domain-containing protein [Oscillospiraceae bacterium]
MDYFKPFKPKMKSLRWIALLCGTVFVICVLLTAFQKPAVAGNSVLISTSALQVSEYSSKNHSFTDPNGNVYNWIELHNTGAGTLDLTGWTLAAGKSYALTGSVDA